MLLEGLERDIFIQWLEDTAETCRLMEKQLEKIGHPATTKLAKREKIKAAACILIANDLKRAEIDG